MKVFEPREVAPGAKRRWLSEALALGSRRPLDMLLFLGAAAALLTFGRLMWSAWVLFAAHPLLLLSAQAADESASRRQTLRSHRKALAGWFAQMATLAILLSCVNLATSWAGAQVKAQVGHTAAPPAWLLPAALLVALVAIVLMSVELRKEFFSLSLRICAGVENPTSRRLLARGGVWLNPAAGHLAVAFCLGLHLSLAAPAVVTALAQYLLAFVQYVAYRDVFLGQAENAPVPVAAAVPAVAPSA